MELHESAEDYLEAILRLQESKGIARSVDVAELLGVSKPSVSVAMKKLRSSGYLVTDEGHDLTLTPEGMTVASRVYERHRVLTAYIVSLGVDEKIARVDACKIEHDLSEATYQAIRKRVCEAKR